MVQLLQPQDTASSLYHAFSIVASATPIIGAIVADSYIGRYWAIVAMTISYVAGNAILTTTALDGGYFEGALVGMLIIALGAGGISSCLSALGGDQYPVEMHKERERFFSMFYFAGNAGAVLTQAITPALRSLPCLGYETCYVLAFGVPTTGLLIAFGTFLCGTPFYSHVAVTKNTFLKICQAIWRGVVCLCKRHKPNPTATHWIDQAVDGVDITQQLADDCKTVFRVLILFLPLPLFWALFDQIGSRWILQAQKMDGYIDFLDWNVEPEQMQMLNSVLVVIFVPLAEWLIYPIFAKCHFLVRPLQRMVTGCYLCATSFVIIGLLQLAVQSSNDAVSSLDPSTYRMVVFNKHPECTFSTSVVGYGPETLIPPSSRSSSLLHPPTFETTISIWPEKGCPTWYQTKTLDVTFTKGEPISTLTLSKINGFDYSVCFQPAKNSYPTKLEQQLYEIGGALLSESPNVATMKLFLDGTVLAEMNRTSSDCVHLDYNKLKRPSDYYSVQVKFSNGDSKIFDGFKVRQGGMYTWEYLEDENGARVEQYTDKGPNEVSVFYQAIPHTTLAWCEILFAITGLSFAFSQAPKSMRSLLQAAWLLTVFFGNLIDIVIIEIQIPDKALEFFIFAGSMFVVTTVFMIQAKYYVYVDGTFGHHADAVSPAEIARSEKEQPANFNSESKFERLETYAEEGEAYF